MYICELFYRYMALNNKKIYYTMGEVAEMFDVNISLIRFWCDSFSLLKPHRNSRGHRLFKLEDIEDIKLVYRLVKERGMTIDGAQRQIKDNRNGVRRDVEIVERLQNIRALLLEVKNELSDDAPIIDSSLRNEVNREFPINRNEFRALDDDFELLIVE